jgi:hypothetical protein
MSVQSGSNSIIGIGIDITADFGFPISTAAQVPPPEPDRFGAGWEKCGLDVVGQGGTIMGNPI